MWNYADKACKKIKQKCRKGVQSYALESVEGQRLDEGIKMSFIAAPTHYVPVDGMIEEECTRHQTSRTENR